MSFEQFMKDLGLDITSKSEETEVAPQAKILSFISLKSMKMDDPRAAIGVHLKNLIATYGKEAVVSEAIKLVDDV